MWINCGDYEFWSIHPVPGVYGDEAGRAIIEALHAAGYRLRAVAMPIRGAACPWCGRRARPGHLWCPPCWAAKQDGTPMPVPADQESGWSAAERRNEGWAAAHGLTINRRQARPRTVPVLRAGCEVCGGMREVGEKYCLRCGKMILHRVRGGMEWAEALAQVMELEGVTEAVA